MVPPRSRRADSDAPKVRAKYPGVKLEVYRGDSDAIIQRVLQEAQAKRFLVDTIETTFPVLKVMQEYKLLAPYYSPHLAQYPDEAKEKADKGLVYWATDRESYIGRAYNTIGMATRAEESRIVLRPELKDKSAVAHERAPGIPPRLAKASAAFVPKLKGPQSPFTLSGRRDPRMVIPGELGVTADRFLHQSRVSTYRGRADQMGARVWLPTNTGGGH